VDGRVPLVRNRARHDEEDGARCRRDRGLPERGRGGCVRQFLHDAVAKAVDPLLEAAPEPVHVGIPRVVGRGPARGALRDDHADAGVDGERPNRLLAAHREPDDADSRVVDLLARGQERHGGRDVHLAPPAVVHRAPLTPPVASSVQREHPVPPAGEEHGVFENGGPRAARAVQEHHRRPVRRGQVPAGELEAVGRRDGDLLVGEPAVGGGEGPDLGARRRRGGDGGTEAEQQHEGAREHHQHHGKRAPPPQWRRQRARAGDEEHEADEEGEGAERRRQRHPGPGQVRNGDPGTGGEGDGADGDREQAPENAAGARPGRAGHAATIPSGQRSCRDRHAGVDAAPPR